MLSAFGREPACCYRTFFLCLVFPVIGNLSLKILTYLCAIPSDKGPKISSTLKSAFIRSYFVSRTFSPLRAFCPFSAISGQRLRCPGNHRDLGFAVLRAGLALVFQAIHKIP